MTLRWLDELQLIEWAIRHMNPIGFAIELFQRHPNAGNPPKRDTHFKNTGDRRHGEGKQSM